MKKLLLLIFLVGWSSKTCTAYEKFAIVAAHVAIPFALYAGNILMTRLSPDNNQKSIITLSSNMEEFRKQIQERYGPKGFALVQDVMNDVQKVAPSATYEYHNLDNHPAQLIIHHNKAKNWSAIHNQSYNRDYSWQLVPNEALSNHKKTVLQFTPIAIDDRSRKGRICFAFDGAS